MPAAEKFTAPADDTPVPEIVRGSADDTAPATSNVAPLATVVVLRVNPSVVSPSAFALVIFTVPAEIAVVPVYVFVPDSVRMLELEVSLVSVPVPEITPVCSVWFDDDEYTNAELFVIAAEYVPEPSEPVPATVNVPAEMVVAPLKVLVPVNVNVPAPDLVNVPEPVVIAADVTSPTASMVNGIFVPVIPPDSVSVPESACISDADVSSVTAPEMVLESAVLRIAPFEETPEPVISIDSATSERVPDNDNAAPDATVVFAAAVPSAALFEIATTPTEIDVTPV